jgi:hypothetical protein
MNLITVCLPNIWIYDYGEISLHDENCVDGVKRTVCEHQGATSGVRVLRSTGVAEITIQFATEQELLDCMTMLALEHPSVTFRNPRVKTKKECQA